MEISSFCKKISSVNSQLSKEINFELFFRNFEHVLFCGRNFAYGALRLVNRPVFTNIDMKRRRCWLSKVYFQYESAYFQRKIFEIFILK